MAFDGIAAGSMATGGCATDGTATVVAIAGHVDGLSCEVADIACAVAPQPAMTPRPPSPQAARCHAGSPRLPKA